MRKLLKRFFCLELVMIFLLAIVFDGLLGLPVNATTTSRDGIALLFPAHQEYKGEESSLGGSLITPFTQTINVDELTGETRITMVACDFEYQSQLDSSLQVRESVFTFKNRDMIKSLGHDKRVTKFDAAKKLLAIEYYLNGKSKGVKKIPEDQNTVEGDTLMVFLQGMLLKKATNFNMDFIQKSRGLKVNANFTLRTINDFQKIAPEYNYPEQLKKLSKQPAEEVYLYVMELTGLPGFIYRYKYYFAYQKEPPYQVVAYWGGPPKDGEFGFVLN
jgi:hypothetical protein